MLDWPHTILALLFLACAIACGVEPDSQAERSRGISGESFPSDRATVARSGDGEIERDAIARSGVPEIDPEPIARSGVPEIDPEPIARVGDAEIDLATLDAPLRIALHDLDWARHRLRRERLDDWLSARLSRAGGQDAGIEDRLEPPRPPRFDLPPSDAIVSGQAAAPVVVTHFIDFASSHSRRLQPVLATLASRFPEQVRIEERQFPLPYHRAARPAAKAARCAQHQGGYAAYREALLVEPGSAAEDLLQYARRISLETARFETCLAEGKAAREVDRDQAIATSIGVTRAATVFVNGLYLTGRPDLERLEAVVAEELRRLGVAVRPGRVDRTSIGAPGKKKEGDEVVPDHYFENPDHVIELSRERVAAAFEDRRALERALEASRGDYDGKRLLKLRRVEPDGLFDRLGLESGDVVVAVDGEFVTADRNAFFEALERGGVVRLILMRKGRPRRLEIRIGSGSGAAS